MNQHPRAKELRLSPLKVSVGSWLTESNRNLYHLHDGEVPTWKAYVDAIHVEGQIKTEADVMADALNTMNTHGLTPSEMVEIIRELREALNWIISDLPSNKDWLNPDCERFCKAALAKTEGF